MKRLAIVILAVCSCAWAQGGILGPILQGSPASGSTNTFTAVHNPSALSTSCTSTNSCAFTVTSTGSGHLLVFTITNTSGSADYATSITGVGTGVCPASSQLHDASTGAVSLCYVLSSTAGQTTATIGFGATSNYVISYSETSYTPGPISLDICNTADNTSASTSAPGASLTSATGTKDFNVQWIVESTGDPSAITTYSNIVFGSGLHSGAADLINTSSFAAPTWTQTSAKSVVGGCAFK